MKYTVDSQTVNTNHRSAINAAAAVNVKWRTLDDVHMDAAQIQSVIENLPAETQQAIAAEIKKSSKDFSVQMCATFENGAVNFHIRDYGSATFRMVIVRVRPVME